MNKTLSIIFIFDFAYHLKNFTLFDIGTQNGYFDLNETDRAFTALYHKSLQKELVNLVSVCIEHEQKVSAYFSGTFLELLHRRDPSMVKELGRAVASGRLTLLGGTYHNSLSSIYSLERFEEEIDAHSEIISRLFDSSTRYFYNTENIFCSKIAASVKRKGFKALFAATIEWYIWKDKKKRIFHSPNDPEQLVFLLDNDHGNSLFVNSEINHHFMQFDSELIKKFGGIKSILYKSESRAQIQSLDEITSLVEKTSAYSIKTPIMGSINELTLESIHSNALQNRALKQYFLLETMVKHGSSDLKTFWSRMGNFRYILNMSKTEYQNHIPYDYYNCYMNILNDIEIKLRTEETV